MDAANTAAGLVAFAAFGANLMAMVLLLLFNPGSRAVRWLALFIVGQLCWLALQGSLLLFSAPDGWRHVYAGTVHMLPALFFAAILVQRMPERPWLPYVPLAAGVLTFLAIPDPLDSLAGMLWHVLMWGLPMLLYALRPRPGRTRLGLLLGGVVPVGVVGSILLQGSFVLYVLPLLTVVIQLMLFYGVVHHRYYDIEVRAARSGELATSAAEHDRLALLGELAATVAHEVRNPLTGIRSLTQMIAEAPVDDERRARYADVILGEIGRLDRIVGNLTDLARRSAAGAVDAVPAAMLELRPLFEDLCMLVEPRARRAGLKLRADAAGMAVHAPRDALAQALLNLLINAVAHSPRGGTVRLSAAGRSGGTVITVSDDGPGIPQADRARIFEPFHSAGGTGLGLAVVRRVAGEHGWGVAVADAAGGGAEFRLEVPG